MRALADTAVGEMVLSSAVGVVVVMGTVSVVEEAASEVEF